MTTMVHLQVQAKVAWNSPEASAVERTAGQKNSHGDASMQAI